MNSKKSSRYSCFTLIFFVHLILPSGLSANEALTDEIERIENGLLEGISIVGQPIKKHSIENRLKHYNIPGVSVAVAYDGKLLWARAYGTADVELSRPMTTETLLLAGSVSKPIAALRGLQLFDEGKLQLDENINTYLKSWQVPENEFTSKEKVTLRRILNHTAGLTIWGFPGYGKSDDVPSTVGVLDGKGNTDPVRVFKTPGEDWEYSGGGYTVMQLAISDLDNKTFAQSMQSGVLNPMQMVNSTYENPLPEKYHHLAATGYHTGGSEVDGKWHIYPEMAAAGLWTTPSDLVHYGIEIQDIISTKKDGIIRYNTAIEMLTPGKRNHGLGPVVTEDTFYHRGADEGFRAHFVAWRDHPYVAVVMVNSDNAGIIAEILRSVTAEYDIPGYKVVEKNVVDIPHSSLEKFTGDYINQDDEIFRILLTDKGLQFLAVNYDYRSDLLPQSDQVFFEKRNGVEMTFTFEEGVPTGILWHHFVAKRIEGASQ